MCLRSIGPFDVIDAYVSYLIFVTEPDRSYDEIISMSRDISPPPAKRRKTDARDATYLQSTPVSVSAAPAPTSNCMLRIFSWNVNGIAPFLQKSITSFFQTTPPKGKSRAVKDVVPPASLRGFLQRHSWPAILFLQEVKIAAQDRKTQDAVRAAVNFKLSCESSPGTSGLQYEAHFTLPTDLHNARGPRGSGKVYGVCSILRSDLRNKYKVNVREVDWDKEGRISVVELEAASEKLALFNIYAVNGTDSPYRNPVNGAIQGTRHDRKLEVHRLLMQECTALEEAGWLVLLAGDMNVALDFGDGHPKLRTFPQQHILNREDFHAKILEGKNGVSKGLNGVDVFRRMHGDERRYTYFPPCREWGTSCDRVDYFVAGERAWNEGIVKACGMMDSELERGPSDHVPIWADIQLGGNEEVGNVEQV